PVVMGIRPEDIAVDPAGDVRGRVFVVEPLGRDDLLDVELDGATRVHVLADPQSKLRAGDAVTLRLDADKIQLFDAETERSLLWA
ncbi:MAG: TOBE domain-containing protein, partial [Chloroflexota bacterium]